MERQRLGTKALDELRQDKPTKNAGYYIESAELAYKKLYIRSTKLAEEGSCIELAEEGSCIESARSADKKIT